MSQLAIAYNLMRNHGVREEVCTSSQTQVLENKSIWYDETDI